MSPTYRVLLEAARLAFWLLARRRVEMPGPLPSGPLIIVSNHLSLADPPLLAVSFPRQLRFLAKREIFFLPLLGQIVWLSGSIALRRHAVDRRALAQAEAHLRQGGILALFPEGHRSRTGALQRAQPGAGFLALRTGVPLVPVAITGTERLRWLWRVLLRPSLTVRVGLPFSVGGPVERPDRQAAAACTDAIMEQIAALLPGSRRGAYHGRAGAAGPAAPSGLAYQQGAKDAS